MLIYLLPFSTSRNCDCSSLPRPLFGWGSLTSLTWIVWATRHLLPLLRAAERPCGRLVCAPWAHRSTLHGNHSHRTAALPSLKTPWKIRETWIETERKERGKSTETKAVNKHLERKFHSIVFHRKSKAIWNSDKAEFNRRIFLFLASGQSAPRTIAEKGLWADLFHFFITPG